MLGFDELKPYYPESLHQYPRFILREYLQYKILEVVFNDYPGNKLVLLGGTCLRIVHNSSRFSEDLDFDNFGLTMEEFTGIASSVRNGLERLGYEIDLRYIRTGAFHCYIRFPAILFREGLSGHKEEKILIRLDSEAHGFEYLPDQPLLNKFDVFTRINTSPADVLLAQKFYAVINRRRNKGRDFYDIIHLLGKERAPDYEYLNAKLGIGTPEDLRKRILYKCSGLDMKKMADEVRPFLFDRKDERKIRLFPEYIQKASLI